uniref:ATP synthase subunit b n=1 Tax=Magnetococcus massalia (strain MO-1) TaxID=451514 RepID=A0A1S7LKY7_MAGMO|nr:ATP synthase subunit b [Candidatus Magnetococcus massalia]
MISTAYAATAAAASEAHKGLPQFDSSTFSSQVFWSVLSFLALLLLLKKFVVPAITDVLDARAAQIEEELNSAETKRQEAEKLLAEQRAEIQAEREKIAQMLESARKEAEATREQAVADLEAELDKQKSQATQEIETARRQAMAEVRDTAVEVAMAVAEKMISKAVDKTEANKLADAAIQGMEAKKDQLH